MVVMQGNSIKRTSSQIMLFPPLDDALSASSSRLSNQYHDSSRSVFQHQQPPPGESSQTRHGHRTDPRGDDEDVGESPHADQSFLWSRELRDNFTLLKRAKRRRLEDASSDYGLTRLPCHADNQRRGHTREDPLMMIEDATIASTKTVAEDLDVATLVGASATSVTAYTSCKQDRNDGNDDDGNYVLPQVAVQTAIMIDVELNRMRASIAELEYLLAQRQQAIGVEGAAGLPLPHYARGENGDMEEEPWKMQSAPVVVLDQEDDDSVDDYDDINYDGEDNGKRSSGLGLTIVPQEIVIQSDEDLSPVIVKTSTAPEDRKIPTISEQRLHKETL